MLALLWKATGRALEQRCTHPSRASWPAARVSSCRWQLMHISHLPYPPLAYFTLAYFTLPFTVST